MQIQVLDCGDVVEYTATLPVSGRKVTVTAYAIPDRDVQINWPAIGSVAVEDAAAFADLVKHAATQAGAE